MEESDLLRDIAPRRRDRHESQEIRQGYQNEAQAIEGEMEPDAE